MKFDNLAFVLYSHSSLKWIWPAFICEMDKYFPIECKRYSFLDDQYEQQLVEDKRFEPVEYSESHNYATRLLECLQYVDEEFVLIHHEDMIFYDYVDMEMFEYYFKIIENNNQFAYLKLIRGGVSNFEPVLFIDGVYNLQENEQYRYAVQPAIWRKSILIKILENCLNCSIYEMEDKASKYMIENKVPVLFAYNKEDIKRGMYHWDNVKYPIISTALSKGKWQDSEYDIEIENLKREYNLS